MRRIHHPMSCSSYRMVINRPEVEESVDVCLLRCRSILDGYKIIIPGGDTVGRSRNTNSFMFYSPPAR